jgi:hypothetical protein
VTRDAQRAAAFTFQSAINTWLSTAITVAGISEATGAITSGKLSLTVPVPLASLLTEIGEIAEGMLTITPATAKGYNLEMTLANKGNLTLQYMEMDILTMKMAIGAASYMYVDQAVTINGEAEISGLKVTANNAKLKKGWNVMLVDMTATVSMTDGSMTGSGTITVGTPSSKYKWTYSAAGSNDNGSPADSKQQLLPQFNLLF